MTTVRLLALLGACAAPTIAAEPTLESVLAEHTRPIAVAGTELRGAGADWLRAEAGAADFLLFGEQHATADIARVATGLFLDLVPAGYTVAAIEVGPWSTPVMERLLRTERGAAFRSLVARPEHRLSFPFFSWSEEVEFAEAAIRAAGGRTALWGLDQEFIGAAAVLLDALAAGKRTAQESTAIAALRPAVAADPMALGKGDDALWSALRDAFAASRDAEARRMVDEILLSRRIYAPFTGRGGRVHSANDERERYMKANLRRHLPSGSAASWPKVFFKFGANHMVYGQSPTDVLSLGTFVHELGLAHGKRTFSLHVDCASGSGMDPVRGEPVPCTSYFLKPEADLRRLLPADRPALVDLRGLRPYRRLWQHWDAGSQRLITAYDAYLLLPSVKPATFVR